MIFQKMSQITNELVKVNKNIEVNTGKSSYKAIGEADVLSAIKPLEEKYKVYSYPVNNEIVESQILTNTQYDKNGVAYERTTFYIRTKVDYMFVDLEDDTNMVISAYGDGLDTGDKATGKAFTYATKYALLKAYKICGGDDLDQEASDDTNNFKPKVETSKASLKQIEWIKKLYPNEDIDYEHLSIKEASDLIKAKQDA